MLKSDKGYMDILGGHLVQTSARCCGLGLESAHESMNEPTMTKRLQPFALPEKLTSELGLVRDYWNGLKRHQNNMPFWDDVSLSALPGLEGRLMLVDVFEKPQRFR